MNFVSELSRQGEKPSHPYMSRTDLSRRRARGRGGRDSLSFLSPLCCRANNFGARLTSTLVVAEKVIVCQTSRARAHNCATNRADSATWPQGGRASASRLPSVFISHSVSGGGAGPKAEDQSLLHICQGDRSLRRVPSGTMTPSLTRSYIDECVSIETLSLLSSMQFVNTDLGSVPEMIRCHDTL